MKDSKKWEVETTRGTGVTIDAASHEVSEHGHLEFSNGAVFARNEWQFVIPV